MSVHDIENMMFKQQDEKKAKLKKEKNVALNIERRKIENGALLKSGELQNLSIVDIKSTLQVIRQKYSKYPEICLELSISADRVVKRKL